MFIEYNLLLSPHRRRCLYLYRDKLKPKISGQQRGAYMHLKGVPMI